MIIRRDEMRELSLSANLRRTGGAKSKIAFAESAA
jgi:hypothetical protein